MSEHYTPLFSSVRHSRKLAALPDDACEVLYGRCLAIADAWGRLPGDPAMLRADAWPLLEHRGKTTAETKRCRDELIAGGLLELHSDDEHGEWIQIPDWEEKAGKVGKRDHRRASRWPDPGQCRAKAGPSTDGAGPTPGQSGPSTGQPSRARAGAHARKPQPQPQPQPEPTTTTGAAAAGQQGGSQDGDRQLAAALLAEGRRLGASRKRIDAALAEFPPLLAGANGTAGPVVATVLEELRAATAAKGVAKPAGLFMTMLADGSVADRVRYHAERAAAEAAAAATASATESERAAERDAWARRRGFKARASRGCVDCKGEGTLECREPLPHGAPYYVRSKEDGTHRHWYACGCVPAPLNQPERTA